MHATSGQADADARNVAIELRGVVVSPEGQTVLRAIDWRVPCGAVAVVLGPNGSGKSTLLKLLAGYEQPYRGEARILGGCLGGVDVHALRGRIGIVNVLSRELAPPHATAHHLVLGGFSGRYVLAHERLTADQHEAAHAALQEVGLGRHAQQRFVTLSSGEQRRALLARALVGDPDLLLLDEPSAGLDVASREALLARLTAAKERRPLLSVVCVTHHLEEVLPGTSEILLLAHGQVVASGPPAEVLRDATLSAAFGCRVEVTQRHGRWWWTAAGCFGDT
jgi:iron complex transport system ATP-binding protein